MIRLRYLFWAMASFLLAGCSQQPETLLVYRWDVLRDEVPAVRPAMDVPDSMASPFGGDEVAGISLNSRSQIQATADYVDGGEDIQYEVYYYDRQGSFPRSYGGYGDGYGGYGGGGRYFSRTFTYYGRGSWSR